MKIEVEIDEDKIYKMVVDKLYDTLLYNARNQVEQAVRLELVGKLREQARVHLAGIMKEFTLPDGRTFRQYMEEALTKPKSTTWGERPKIQQLVDDYLYRQADSVFRELVEPHLKEFKEKLRDNIFSRILG